MSTATPQTAASGSRPESFRRFVWICLAFAALKLAIQVVGNILAQHAGYGIFRDEMYYLICGRHLAFGYVDQPPMVALQARLSELLFGYNQMWSLRLISALAGAATVFFTGALVWAMRGTRAAAALAMLGVTVAGVYLGLDSFLSMNSFEPVFWMLCALALIRIAAEHAVPGREPRVRFWWIVLGISAGLGLENKDNIVFFLVAVLIALLLTPQRRILASRGFAVALALIVAIALPNLLWQIHYHFPTLEWLVDVSHSNKDVKPPPLAFLGGQLLMLTPWTAPLWITGLVWLFFARRARPLLFLGVLYLVFLGLMMALHAKDYYLAPIYPLYFAAGAVCWLPASTSGPPPPSRSRPLRTALISAYALLLCIGFVLTVPFSIPVLRPHPLVTWMKTMRFQGNDSENHAPTVLPQFYADRFGWHEMVEKVAHVYNALPPQERAVTGIFAGNYGEASAINLFGPKYGLPVAISGHQTYWLWGPHGYTGQEMIIITGESLADLKPYYASCQVMAKLDNPLAMPWEHKDIDLCRGRFRSYQADWKDFKYYY
ncbi:MAG TPA: glycosyltransferase family 39 protein [Acidobacteriaceae bacterium]|nr:glycosyltransferase family 39 protein [Acidobacteriaceae bacterium]